MEQPRKQKPITSALDLLSTPSYTRSRIEKQKEVRVESCKKLTKEEVKEQTLKIAGARELLPEYEVDSTILHIFDKETIMSMCVCEINRHESNGPNTLNDPKMGCIDINTKCETCGSDAINCPGHFGYIKMTEPIYHPFYGKLLSKVLSCICLTCAKPYLSKDEMIKKGILNQQYEVRLNMLMKESEQSTCCNKGSDRINKCGAHVPITWDKERRKLVFEVTQKTQYIDIEKEEDEEPSEKKKKDKKFQSIPISFVIKLLNGISDETAELLGFNTKERSHPKNFILSYYVVMPPVARQPRVVDGKVMEDRLTEQYRTIIKTNNSIKLATTPSEKQIAIKKLYDDILYLISGQDTSGQGGDYKSIETRIQGKEGLIRSNMMGRRVNYSARTVLGPGPNLKIGQIGVPRAFSKILLQKVTVYTFNRQSLQKLFDEGKIHRLTPSSGKLKGQYISNLDQWRKKNYKLQDGDIVERELQNGDYVLINRQPTLHKQSFMGGQVVLHDDLNTRIPLEVVKGFNADFDGDEGNLFIVHDPQSIAEILEVTSMNACIMNSQSNKPNYAPYYDALTGVYILTGDDVYFISDSERDKLKSKLLELEKSIDKSRNEIQNLYKKIIKFFDYIDNKYKNPTLSQYIESIRYTYTFDNISKIKNYLDTNDKYELETLSSELKPLDFQKQIDDIHLRLSSTLDDGDFNDIITYMSIPVDIVDLTMRANKYNLPIYSGKGLFSAALPRDFNYKKGDVVIRDGILISGRITSSTIGTTHNSIIQVMFKNYDAVTTNEFSSNIKFITDQFLARRGFTVGYDDCVLPESKQREQSKIIMDAYAEAQSAAYRISKKSNNPLEEERRESQITRYIDSVKSVGKKISEIVGADNALVTMYSAGSKGSELNIAQITTTLGQQFLKGKRFPTIFTDNTRCIPTYEPNSLDIRSRGFCLNSFMTGLTPTELFFHQAGGRTGLIDTALKTADVGDMHRKLVKTLEDIRVVYDGSVRNNKGNIIQFLYGDDGFDAGNLQFTPGPTSNIPSFIDIDADALDINTKYGY